MASPSGDDRAGGGTAGDGEGPRGGVLRDAWLFGSGERKSLRGGPGGVLDLRIQEIAQRFSERPVTELMATPTRVNGSLDAAVLLERLTRAQAGGWEPWPVDFEQALLRLPRDTDPDVVRQAAELTSVAGRRFAAWLKDGGLPDPVSTRREQTGRDGRYAYGGTPPLRRRTVAQLDQARGGMTAACWRTCWSTWRAPMCRSTTSVTSRRPPTSPRWCCRSIARSRLPGCCRCSPHWPTWTGAAVARCCRCSPSVRGRSGRP
ncbi:hypothetical protein AMIS_35310 [Actinoplanes missouriensis 431]|uniref:Uncharacterized protein n=1 Tax=Actinoplanes missouriensis (strain ATCC 14538 / DSM 43046 / CBS 188.64 / JCM 3121 / NBRC 102363 / NCIMB 12654 / NRRL B-3342 / UNCC 431) TaxID=512565 RepID=I0H6W4_ACTM4|nr:hypothetical protein AMIS_35310 [Actinoplanes missouriensis 431]